VPWKSTPMEPRAIERTAPMTFRSTAAAVAALALTAVGVAGCTAQTTNADSPPPVVSETPSPTPTDDARADEAMLPIPVDEIGDWAETAVPPSDSGALTGRLTGWMSQNTSPHQRNSFEFLEAGDYQGQLACRGGGTIVLSAGELGSESLADTVSCDNSTIAFGVSISQTGMTIDLDLEGDPSIYAVSLTRMG
jgi:hypothetical protein